MDLQSRNIDQIRPKSIGTEPSVKNLTGAKGGRDQTAMSFGSLDDEFYNLYDSLVNNINNLIKISSDNVFHVELNKIKKFCRIIIDKYFEPALLDLSPNIDVKELVSELKIKIRRIFDKLNLKFIYQKIGEKNRNWSSRDILPYIQSFTDVIEPIMERMDLKPVLNSNDLELHIKKNQLNLNLPSNSTP
jgi:hypothetical protein